MIVRLEDRGVQRPGYNDPKTKQFLFVKEMVPELVVPDLSDFDVSSLSSSSQNIVLPTVSVGVGVSVPHYRPVTELYRTVTVPYCNRTVL